MFANILTKLKSVLHLDDAVKSVHDEIETTAAPFVTLMLNDLKAAAAKFREYEQIHTAKDTAEGLVKAAENGKIATQIEETIALVESKA